MDIKISHFRTVIFYLFWVFIILWNLEDIIPVSCPEIFFKIFFKTICMISYIWKSDIFNGMYSMSEPRINLKDILLLWVHVWFFRFSFIFLIGFSFPFNLMMFVEKSLIRVDFSLYGFYLFCYGLIFDWLLNNIPKVFESLLLTVFCIFIKISPTFVNI